MKKLGLAYPGSRIALVGATRDDIRDTMVEGESGLLPCLPDSALRGGSRDTAWNRSMIELYLANGTKFKGFSSEKPNKLRGPQHHFAWVDEIATIMDVDKGIEEESTTVSNLLLGIRPGDRPQCVITGTPKKKRVLVGFSRKGERTTRRACSTPMYEGTRTGRQELNAEILEDVEGALWTQQWIEESRRHPLVAGPPPRAADGRRGPGHDVGASER